MLRVYNCSLRGYLFKNKIIYIYIYYIIIRAATAEKPVLRVARNRCTEVSPRYEIRKSRAFSSCVSTYIILSINNYNFNKYFHNCTGAQVNNNLPVAG